MEGKCKSVVTDLGCIESKRDAIYLDSLEQINNSLILKGEINSSFCEEKYQDYKWYAFQLVFKSIEEYKCLRLEKYYLLKMKSESAFFEFLDEGEDGDSEIHTFIIETYDFVYIILSKNFEFSILGRR